LASRPRRPRRLSALATLTFCLSLCASFAAVLWTPIAARADTGARPVRWASLLPFVGSALRGVDAGFAPVAEVRAALHAPPPEGTADLGSAHQPNFEVLLSVSPVFVVGDRVLHAPLAGRLAQAGVELVLLDTSSVAGTLDGLRLVADRVGAEAAIEPDLARVDAALVGVELAGAPRVLALFGVPGRYLLLTADTWVGDLIVRCGGRLVSPDPAPATGGPAQAARPERRGHPGYVQVSDEWLTAQRPDVVLLLSHGDPAAIEGRFRERLAEGGAWQSLADSTAGRIHALSPVLFSTNPGLGLPEAARALRLAIDERPSVAVGPTS